MTHLPESCCTAYTSSKMSEESISDKPASKPKSRESSKSRKSKSDSPPKASSVATPKLVVTAPPGLEYLTLIDQLIIHQELQWMAVFAGWEQNNRYVVANSANQPVYFAVEVNDIFTVNYLGSSRPWEMVVLDNFRREILRIVRPFRPREFAIFGVLQMIQVRAGPHYLGAVEQVWRFFGAQFRVLNAAGQTVLWIEGPPCRFNFASTDFNILSADGSYIIGVITRHFPGLFNALYTKADIFGVRFPLDLDVAMKAVLLAATFLIDFMYFEDGGRGQYHHRHY